MLFQPELCRNRAWEKFYGYSVAESQGKDVIELLVGPVDATIANKIMEQILQGETHGGEFVVKNKKGERFIAFGFSKPLYDENGQIIGVTCISTTPNPYPETGPEPKVGAPINAASEQPSQSDLAIKVELNAKEEESSSMINCDYRQKQPRIHNIPSPKDEWMVKNGISWPWKGNERKGARFDARSCCHWLYHSDQLHGYVRQMTSRIPAKVESQPQVNNTNTLSQLFSSFDKEYEIKWEDLMIRECIGRGSYGKLYHAVWYGSNVAVKLIPREEYSHDLILSFRQEVSFMKRFRHPNILLFMGAIVSPQHLCIVTEFLSRGSLFQLLHRSKGRFNLRHHVHMAFDIVNKYVNANTRMPS